MPGFLLNQMNRLRGSPELLSRLPQQTRTDPVAISGNEKPGSDAGLFVESPDFVESKESLARTA